MKALLHNLILKVCNLKQRLGSEINVLVWISRRNGDAWVLKGLPPLVLTSPRTPTNTTSWPCRFAAGKKDLKLRNILSIFFSIWRLWYSEVFSTGHAFKKILGSKIPRLVTPKHFNRQTFYNKTNKRTRGFTEWTIPWEMPENCIRTCVQFCLRSRLQIGNSPLKNWWEKMLARISIFHKNLKGQLEFDCLVKSFSGASTPLPLCANVIYERSLMK